MCADSLDRKVDMLLLKVNNLEKMVCAQDQVIEEADKRTYRITVSGSVPVQVWDGTLRNVFASVGRDFAMADDYAESERKMQIALKRALERTAASVKAMKT